MNNARDKLRSSIPHGFASYFRKRFYRSLTAFQANNYRTIQLSITVQNKGDNNSNISNRVKKMGDSISINNGGDEDKRRQKNVIILGDSVIKHVNGYDIEENWINVKYL